MEKETQGKYWEQQTLQREHAEGSWVDFHTHGILKLLLSAVNRLQSLTCVKTQANILLETSYSHAQGGRWDASQWSGSPGPLSCCLITGAISGQISSPQFLLGTGSARVPTGNKRHSQNGTICGGFASTETTTKLWVERWVSTTDSAGNRTSVTGSPLHARLAVTGGRSKDPKWERAGLGGDLEGSSDLQGRETASLRKLWKEPRK